MTNTQGNSPKRQPPQGRPTILTSEDGKQRRVGILLPETILGGLARVDQMPLLTAEQVEKALSGYVLGLLKLDREQIACVKLLGEFYGLWGPGRKPPASDEKLKPQPFQVKDVDAAR